MLLHLMIADVICLYLAIESSVLAPHDCRFISSVSVSVSSVHNMAFDRFIRREACPFLRHTIPRFFARSSVDVLVKISVDSMQLNSE